MSSVGHSTLGALREATKHLPDTAIVLVPSRDHEYRPVAAEVATALFDQDSFTFTEDHGEDLTPEAEYGKRIEVVIIGL